MKPFMQNTNTKSNPHNSQELISSNQSRNLSFEVFNFSISECSKLVFLCKWENSFRLHSIGYSLQFPNNPLNTRMNKIGREESCTFIDMHVYIYKEKDIWKYQIFLEMLHKRLKSLSKDILLSTIVHAFPLFLFLSWTTWRS